MSVLERVQRVQYVQQGDIQPSQTKKEARKLQKFRASLKEELIERIGLATVAEMLDMQTLVQAKQELRVVLETLLHKTRYNTLSKHERELLQTQVIDEICGFGPIQKLLEDPSITEVMINGADSLFYERNGELFQADVGFDSDEQIMLVIDRILAPLGRRLDRANPLVNARLANGDRVHAVAPPIALNGPSVTIRKFSDRIRTLERLVSMEALPDWYATLLSWAVKTRQGIAVVGGTGSGKTTLLNALSTEIDERERIITIEDSAELRFDTHPNVVRLEARDASIEGSGEITIRELVKNALRMRPDRIVVGEVRGEECIDMLQAMNTGHDGSLTTLHAGTPQEAILRLVLMARFGMDLPTDVIEAQIATALDLIVMSQRSADGKRYITSLTEVSLSADKSIEQRLCVHFDQTKKSWSLAAEPRFIQKALAAGQLQEAEVSSWKARVCSFA